ncbi:MAG: hypothetical protein GX452_13715 [Ignavibacteriales bacterium]|jgi:hypothetical protein|nr:hypothetical protein [Ignavibacteriaceae bacterium]NLH62451.1 hypothetical protein [Ignavibacteriales bacterium]HOJ19538.1 hypothetical protein [Ignavibacteriaceae bacterium]HPO57056.1 hypothetical protein [Ignavibacteriaceae bacterium]
MTKTFDLKVATLSTIIGIVLVLFMAWLTGDDFGAPVFPFMAVLSAYIISGIVIGFTSKGETIVEPGVASIITGVVTYFIITAMNLSCFKLLAGDVFAVNMLLLTLNGIILAFAGAWTGEKFQLTFENKVESKNVVEWGWIIAGTIIGVTASIFLAGLIIKAFTATLTPFFIVLAVGILLTGLVVGWRSPGVTIKESAIAGILTAVIILDIFKFTLDPDTTSLTSGSILLSVVIGLIAALIGGVIGEKIQASGSKK